MDRVVVGMILAVLGVPLAAQEVPERITPGFGIRSMTLGVGTFYLGRGEWLRGTQAASLPRFVQAASGAVELGWRSQGRPNRAEVLYQIGHNWNGSYEPLNGLDHAARLMVLAPARSRLRRTFTFAAESRLLSSVLYRPASRPLFTPSLERGVIPGGELPLVESAVAASFFGARRHAAGAALDLAWEGSPRTLWYASLGGAHQRPGQPGASGVPRERLHPQATMGSVTAGFHHEQSRRTAIGGEIGASQGWSTAFRTRAASAALSASRELTPGWRGFVRGGYAMLQRRDLPGRGPAHGYQAALGITGANRTHTFTAAVRRDLTDRMLLGMESTLGGDLVWDIRPRGSHWLGGAGASYLRMRPAAGARIEGMVYRITVGRRVGRHWTVSVDTAYATARGRIPALLSDFVQGGARVSLAWTPQP